MIILRNLEQGISVKINPDFVGTSDTLGTLSAIVLKNKL